MYYCPTPRRRVGDSWAKVMGDYFFIVPAMQGKLQGFDIKILTPGRFSIVKGRAKSMVLISSLFPVGGVHSRALKTEKSQCPPFPVGGGAVITND